MTKILIDKALLERVLEATEFESLLRSGMLRQLGGRFDFTGPSLDLNKTYAELRAALAYPAATVREPLTEDDLCEIMVRLGITAYGPAAEAVEALTREIEAVHGIGKPGELS